MIAEKRTSRKKLSQGLDHVKRRSIVDSREFLVVGNMNMRTEVMSGET
jgi:hypothetical protein